MGGDTPVYNAKNILESPPSDFPFIAYLNSNYEKSAKCIPTFRRDKFFPFCWNIDKSVSTQCFFPKKEKNKSKFRKVNLCDGGIKDFVELREIIHLKIWTHFSVRQIKLF